METQPQPESALAPAAVQESTFSVIVVTYNNENEIAGCLDSILAEPGARQVVVVDNASGDSTPKLLQQRAATEPRLSLHLGRENLGFGKACNLGLEQAAEPLALLLNPDAALIPGALASLALQFAQHPEAGILGLKVYDWDGQTVQLSCRSFPSHRTALFNRYSLLTRLLPSNRYSRSYLQTDFGHGQVASFDWVSGCAMAIRRSMLERIGLFDEDYFMFSEDVDLCRRARNAGYEVLFVPGAQARHRIGSSSRSAPALVIRARHRSMWLYYKKHLRGSWLLDALTYVAIQARCAWLLALASLKRAAVRQ